MAQPSKENVEAAKEAQEAGASKAEVQAILFDTDYVKGSLGDFDNDDDYRNAFDSKMQLANDYEANQKTFNDALGESEMSKKFLENLFETKSPALAFLKSGYTREMLPQDGDEDFEAATAMIKEMEDKKQKKGDAKRDAKSKADNIHKVFSEFISNEYKDDEDGGAKYRDFLKRIDGGFSGSDMDDEGLKEFFAEMKGYMGMKDRIAQEREEAAVTERNKKIGAEMETEAAGDGMPDVKSAEAKTGAAPKKKKTFHRGQVGKY